MIEDNCINDLLVLQNRERDILYSLDYMDNKGLEINNFIYPKLSSTLSEKEKLDFGSLNKDDINGEIDFVKVSYKPKEEETEFISLDNTDLSRIMCIKYERTILNGNMISFNNHYYIPINNDGTDYIFYKGTKVEVWADVFEPIVKIYKNNKIYDTRMIEGHRKDPIKREQKRIQDQKELEKLFKERDERLKARAKRS